MPRPRPSPRKRPRGTRRHRRQDGVFFWTGGRQGKRTIQAATSAASRHIVCYFVSPCVFLQFCAVTFHNRPRRSGAMAPSEPCTDPATERYPAHCPLPPCASLALSQGALYLPGTAATRHELRFEFPSKVCSACALPCWHNPCVRATSRTIRRSDAQPTGAPQHCMSD